MDATFVSARNIPSIISTTPNSPTVCANVSTNAALSTEGFIFGNKTLISVLNVDLPRENDASLIVGGSAEKPIVKDKP